MITVLTSIYTLAATMLPLLAMLDANSEEGGGGAALLLLLAGPIYFIIIYARYRNTDKRHHHELETKAAIEDVQASDVFIEHRKRMRNAQINGRNDNAVRGALLDNSTPAVVQTVKKMID
jgi:hypothetical protein